MTSVVVLMTEGTEAATLRAELAHAGKMAAGGQRVSGLAQQVNHRLTTILGVTDLLLEDPTLSETARRNLGVVREEARRTKEMVETMLSLARPGPSGTGSGVAEGTPQW